MVYKTIDDDSLKFFDILKLDNIFWVIGKMRLRADHEMDISIHLYDEWLNQ